jgi:predicted outer membrane protein
MRHAAHRTITLAALLLVSAAACGKKDADETATTTTSGGAVATAENVSVTDVKLGKAVDANRRGGQRYPPDPAR